MGNVNITMTVVPRKIFTVDADGRVKVTPDDLNDLGNPIISGVTSESALVRYPVVAVSNVSATKNSVAIAMYLDSGTVAGIHRLNAWLTDSDVTLAETSTVPSITNKRQLTVLTAADGTATVVIEHSGTKTWYLAVEYAGRVYVSDALVFT